MTVLLLHKNAFRPSADTEQIPVRPGTRFSTQLRQMRHIKGRGKSMCLKTPFVVVRNGQPLLQKQWSTKIKKDDVISIVHLPKGGGGGSNPLQAVLIIAIAVAAAYTGGFVAGAQGLGMGAGWGAAASAAVMIGGTLLMNMFFPPQTPSALDYSKQSASPTYTLSAQGNTARLLEAIPVLYGRFRTYPDLASSPYFETVGNEQYLYQLFCITQGQMEIEKIQVENDDVASYGEIQYQIVNPGQPVTLFPDNVITSIAVNGLELEPSVTFGPFSASGPGVETNFIAVDIFWPGGAYRMDNQGNFNQSTTSVRFEYQKIDDQGQPQGTWQVLVEKSYTFATSTAQSVTEKVEVPLGRYQVRGMRTNGISQDNKEQNKVQWSTLRGYAQSQRDYGDVTLLAVIMKASNNLNQQTSRRINVIGTRKLPVWDPVNGWSVNPIVTCNPMWAACDILRNSTYGRRMPTSRLNIQEAYRLSQVYDSRGDEFNGVFDTTSQLWDALSKVLRAGRTVPVNYAGLIDFVRNEPKTVATYIFQPQNMLENSFSTDYLFVDSASTPNYVQIEYTNADTWSQETVDCVLPGVAPTVPAKVAMLGITNRAQAWREGISMAAANRDQRRMISFTTGREGYLPRYGDMVTISHDVPQWGYSGEVLGFNPGPDDPQWGLHGEIVSNEPFVFTAGSNHQIVFRKRDGSPHGPFNIVAHPSGDEFKAVVQGTEAQLDDIYISDGSREELTQYQFGPTERRGIRAIALSATPDADGKVQLTFTNYADSVHSAESGGVVPPPGPESNLPGIITVPIVDSVTVVLTPFAWVQNIVATPARGAFSYEFEISQDGVNWSNLGISTSPSMQVNLNGGTWFVRARGIGNLIGPWATWTGIIEASVLPVSQIDHVNITGEVFAIGLEWAVREDDFLAESVEIYWGTTNILGNATKLIQLPLPASRYTVTDLGPGDRRYFWFRVIDEAGRVGPWYNSGVGLMGQSSDQADLIMAYLDGQITETQLAQSLITKIESGGEASVEVEAIKNDLAAMYTVKTQLTAGGRTALAGIGVGVENNQGVLESQVLVLADRFAVGRSDDVTGTFKSMFVVDAGNVYMNSAFIQDGTITNAKIGNTIQSNNFVPNVSGWRLSKSGVFENNGSTGEGRRVDTSTRTLIYYANGNLAVAMGIGI
ncbi:putative tail protein [Achromobacter phage AMA2]|nr:putative tail protein [Achromobacter phage AMA2]